MQIQVNIDDGFLNLMTSDGTPKDDVKVPEGDLGKDIQTAFDDGKDLLVTIISAMGEEQVRRSVFQSHKHMAHSLCLGHLLQGGPQNELICG